jgi:hypothetical protein
MASISSEGQTPKELVDKAIVIDCSQKEVVLRFIKPHGLEARIVVIETYELLSLIEMSGFRHIGDPTLPDWFVEDFKDCQRRRREGEGLSVPPLTSHGIEAQKP